MADPTTTRKDIRQKAIKKLYAPRFPIVSTTTSTGGTSATTSIVDSILAPSGQVEDYNRAFIYISSSDGDPAVGSIARVTNTDFSGSNSILTIAPALSSAPETGVEYEVHYKFHPSAVNDKINEILENIRGWVFIPLSGLLTNGNFNTDASSWTASGATLTYNSTAANVLFGVGSLQVDGTTAQYGYQRVYVSEDTPLLVSAFAKAVDSAASAEIELWDVTNSVQIGEAANTDVQGEWVHLQIAETVPDTCKQVEVRVYGGAAGQNVFYDSVQLLRRDQQIHPLPSDFDWPEDFELVSYFPLGDGIDSANSNKAYRAIQRPLEKWSDAAILRDPRGTATRIQLKDNKEIDVPLFIRGRVDYPTVSDDTTSIYAPEDYVVNLVYADLMEDLAQEDLAEDNFEAFRSKMEKAADTRNKIAFLARNYTNDKAVLRGAFN